MAEYIETDVLIIGSGIAGSTAALTLAEQGIRSIMISKGKDETKTNTNLAQGGIALLGKTEDPEAFIEDIIRGGDGVNYPDAVRQVVVHSRELVTQILINKLKVPFSKSHGEYDYAQEGGHSQRRILNVRDMTGKAIQASFYNYLKKQKNLEIMFKHTAIDLLTHPHHSTNPHRIFQEPQTIGAYVLDQVGKKVKRIFARKVILASGGLSSIFLHSTNPEDAIGNGISMAHRAGARLAHLEYVQFHPTALFHDEGHRFLISEAVRGEGAKLMNRKGRYFMKDYTARGELAPRDEVARAIYAELIKRGDDYVLLDLASFAKINIRERFPTIYKTCMELGLDIEKRPIPVVPAAHYGCGGVISDLNGRSSLRNLYAIGEASATGVHGANRLASVSLLEGLVWGVKAAEHIIKTIGTGDPPYTISEVPTWRFPASQEKMDPALVWQDQVTIRYIMWNYSGIIRTAKRLERAKSDLEYLRHRIIQFYQKTELNNKIINLRDSVQTAMMVVLSALQNKKSLGSHYFNANGE